MKLRAIFILTTFFCLSACKNSGNSVFSDKTYQDSIKQNIGGSLVRHIHYYNNFHSFIYDIEYSFKNGLNSVYNIGSGSYYSQEPPKDEQLIQYAKWNILKTSKDRDADVLFIGNNTTKVWTKYEISPETIEETELWKKQNINSQVDNWDTVAKIEEIDNNGIITVLYTYAKKDRVFSFITSKRKIKLKINSKTGRPEMTTILEL